MRKSHTTFSRLTADTFNLHKMFGDGVIAVGQFSVVGTDIIVPSYTVQYNGIIVEETSPQTVAFTATDNYVCVHGIDASETSTPTIEALPAPLGVILLERAGATGWRSAKPLTITNGRRQQSFRRIADGSDLYLSYGAGYGEDDTRGTVRNIAIDSLDQLPFDDMTVGESLAAAGSIPWAVGVTGWASCKNAFMYTDGVDTFIQYEPDIMGIMPLQILAVVPTVMSVCALSPTRFAYAYYDAAVPNVVIVNSWTAGNPAPDGVDISITLPFDPVDVDILSGTEIVAQDATGIIIQATFNSVGTLSNIRNSVTRDTYFINNGHLSFTDTLGDVYLDWSYVKPAYGAFSYAMNNGEEIIELDVIGANHVAIQNGCVTKVIPTRVFGTGRFLVGDKIVIATSGMMGGISARFYDTKTYSTSVGISTSGMFLIDLIETDNYFVYYNGTDRVSLNHSPTSVGSLVEQSVDIQGRALCRYGKKELHLRSDVDYLYMYSNTHLKTSNYVNTMAFVGTYAGGVPITPIPNAYYTVIDRETYDGDHFLFLGGMTKGYACETPDGTPYGVVPGIVADIAADQFSGDMYVEGGWYIGMTVNATDTVISNARIMNLTIEHVRNVNFIGCDILAYTDIVDPLNNTYKFIGCTIGGVPANTFLALTDTPMAYVSSGDMLVTNATATGLEFAAAARQTPVGAFQFARQDVTNETGAISPAWDQPASAEINVQTGDPTGFENRTDSTLTYDPEHSATKGRLTLSRSGALPFYVWHNGVRYSFTDPVVFEHDRTWGTPEETLTYFMYFIEAGGVLVPTVGTSFWNLSTAVPVAYVTYNKVIPGSDVPNLGSGFACEERHGMCMDWATHKHLHLIFGAHAESGFGLTAAKVPYVNPDSNKVQIEPGVIADEDIDFDNAGHTGIVNYKLMYRYGASGYWYWQTLPDFPYSISGVWATANTYSAGTWDLRPLAHNNWMNVFFFGSNALRPDCEDFDIVCIPGQTIHTSLTNALGETVDSLALGTLPFQEFPPLYRATYQTQNGWGDAQGRARIVSLVRITSSMVNSVATSVANHPSLSGLTLPNQHPDTSISYASDTFDYGDGVNADLLTCDQVHEALDQLIKRFTGDATWTAGAPPTFVNYSATPTWTTALGYRQIVSVTADILCSVTAAPGLLPADPDLAHRKLVATLSRSELGVYSILTQDSEIIHEDTTFEDARLDPATYLSGISDYVELTVSGTTFSVTCGAISGKGRCRYSVNIIINELTTVSLWPV